MKQISLPSTFIYEFQLDEQLVDESLKCFLEKEITALVPADAKKQNVSKALFYKNEKSATNPMYHKELYDELQKCVDQVCNLHFTSSKLVICDSWVTKTSFGDSSYFHHHPYSIFSGLLYFTSHKNSETLFQIEDPFYKKYYDLFRQTIVPQNYILKSQPVKGKLLIWDSSIQHRISTHKEKNIRYTYAFNTWFTGIIGFDTTAKLVSNTLDISQFPN